MGEEKIDIVEAKKEVSTLIFKVLTGHLSVKNALLKFPTIEDKSINAAWHALMHYEADEDISASDKLYAQEQFDYLEFIAFSLRDGKDLPQNIINSYKPFHEDTLISKPTSIKNILKMLTKNINIFKR